MADVAQALLAAGATDLVQAAAAGDITALLTAETPQRERVAALRMAAEHGRLDVIDQLLSAATPVDGVDADGSTALHEAACSGRADSVRHLLARGADPGRRDTRFGGTPLGWCRHWRDETGPGHGHEEVEQLLAQRAPPGIPWPQNIVAVSGGIVRDSRGAAPCVQITVIHRHAGRATVGLEA